METLAIVLATMGTVRIAMGVTLIVFANEIADILIRLKNN